jgi:hypothetical protein
MLATVLYDNSQILDLSISLLKLNKNIRYNSNDITRCGIVAESLLNNLYFSSEDDLKNNIIMYHFDLNQLQRIIGKKKNIICRISWSVWEKTQFNLSQSTGEFIMPAFEHTYLIDLTIHDAYMIQAAFGIYGCSVQPIKFESLWEHLLFLSNFDRISIIDGKTLADWIKSSVFLDKPFIDLSFDNNDYIGQLISFTCFSYNYADALKNLNIYNM